MSPEQWKNLALDGRSDLYAWGVMMFEMLTGKLPLHSSVVHEFAALATNTPPPPIRELMPELPLGLANLIHACLAKVPEERPSSARAATEALANLR
jgi:serine/threonine-protein kinase